LASFYGNSNFVPVFCLQLQYRKQLLCVNFLPVFGEGNFLRVTLRFLLSSFQCLFRNPMTIAESIPGKTGMEACSLSGVNAPTR